MGKCGLDIILDIIKFIINMIIVLWLSRKISSFLEVHAKTLR